MNLRNAAVTPGGFVDCAGVISPAKFHGYRISASGKYGKMKAPAAAGSLCGREAFRAYG